MVRGSCLCSTVQWHYAGSFDQLTHCHCHLCRKAHGAAFASYAVGPAEPFTYQTGTEAIVEYESSPGFIRSFCKHCGSVVPNTKLGNIVALPAGGLDGDIGRRPDAHIFTKWKAAWYKITDQLPQHDNYPGQSAPAVERVEPTPSTDGLVRGSCMCGGISFSLNETFRRVHHCHCSRCRKARAAAHATNGITSADAVEFAHGADNVKFFKLAGAKYYSQAFCKTCGSGVPQIDESRGIAFTPLGVLDDLPSRGPDDHIFVGSKASWFEITDQLQQFDKMPV